MSEVSLGTLSLDSYREIIGETEIQAIQSYAKKLEGKSVVHVNSTAFGGGVSEMLRRIVPLMRDVDLDAHWKVIKGEMAFFDVTKSFHNALQGKQMPLSAEMKQVYLKYNKLNAESLDLDYDYVVIHDPQPLALIDYQTKKKGNWIWRCHIDLSQPNMQFWRFMASSLEKYDAYIFTAKQYVKSPLEKRNVALITPSIDPLSNKCKPLSESQVFSVLERYNVNPECPLLNQVARFDSWKDPLGVIDVYRAVKKEFPKVQLLLISSMATDDPEGWSYYEKTARHAGEDQNIHMLTDLKGVGDLEVNAFQTASDVTLLKSLREGFGLTVTESLWKQVPVVGGNVGGIPLQVIDGETGFLVDTIKQAAQKTMYLLKHPQQAKLMGETGKKHVKENFLITEHLKKYLKLFLSIK